MLPPATLLLCALFLRRVSDADASRRGRCVAGLCYFQDRRQFQAANSFCSDHGAQLLQLRGDAEDLRTLLSGVSGRFWLRGGTEAGSCRAAAAAAGRVIVASEPCGRALDGFVCQCGPDEMCGPVQGRAGVHIEYVFSEDFGMVGSDTFPPGTVATARSVGAEHPGSRQLCVSAAWVAAPWGCEVLNGGCEHDCDPGARACACPAGSTVHPNNVSCVRNPCADCKQLCHPQGLGYVCACDRGYRLAPDNKSCVDADECKEAPDACTNEGEECVNVRGGYECRCADGFDEEDGACVNVSICAHCEHMTCPKIDGVYQCACRKGFRVSPADPTKCVFTCTERDCPAVCTPDPEREQKDMQQCFCPDGYVTDIRDHTATCTDIDECEHQSMCDHHCENLFGGFRCACNEGHTLQDGGKCVRVGDEYEDEESGSGASTVRAPAPSREPASFPAYVKTGSVLGMSAFVVVLSTLLVCVVRHMSKRCSAFTLHTFKHPELDIFYLQQVSTETYTRLSLDRGSRGDAQRPCTAAGTQEAKTENSCRN